FPRCAVLDLAPWLDVHVCIGGIHRTRAEFHRLADILPLCFGNWCSQTPDETVPSGSRRYGVSRQDRLSRIWVPWPRTTVQFVVAACFTLRRDAAFTAGRRQRSVALTACGSGADNDPPSPLLVRQEATRDMPRPIWKGAISF